MRGFRVLLLFVLTAGVAVYMYYPRGDELAHDAANDLVGGKAYDTARIAHLKQLQVGLEIYYTEHEAYPKTSNERIAISPSTAPCVELLLGGYIEECPVDPSGARYVYSSDGATFSLEAILEDAESPFCESGDAGCIHEVTQTELPFPDFDEEQ